MRFINKMRRVDVQVSILICVTTIFCSFCIAAICYGLTYNDMIKSLEDRVYAIYNYLEDTMDKSTFSAINSKEDMELECYQEMHGILNSIKQASNVRYLYTAKRSAEGELIYLVDGLDYTVGDFRYPGDMIEQEICADMETALSGEAVLPNTIKNTEWGKIFITYFPVHDGQQVVGTLGIEFEAGHQYEIYTMLLRAIPTITILFSAAATILALLIFRRISNPIFQDMSNTDQLTQLKNRNAYETDIHNMNVPRKRTGFGVIAMDLNNLKKINDLFGHGKGDLYIQAAADTMRDVFRKKALLYRIGGDEYAILLMGTNKDELHSYINQIHTAFIEKCKEVTDKVPLSLSAGCALYDETMDQDLISVAERADAAMYEKKKEFHGR